MSRHDYLIEKKAAGGGTFSTPGTDPQYPPDLSLEPIHTEIALTVDVMGKSAEGTVTHTVVARRAGVNSITFNAVDFQNVSAKDADGKELTFRYDGEKLAINWADEFSEGEERRVAITYRVEEPITGLFFSQPDAEYPDNGTWAATDHETERARYWLPCIDLPNVRCKLDFHLKAEKRFEILANGGLVGEEIESDGWKTAHWKLEQRCPSYLTCFAIGEFTRCDDGEHQGKPIAYFCETKFPAEDLKRSFGRTGEMLDWMTAKLDMEYPFPKYYQFALMGIGGAMENISLVSWEDMFVLDETYAKEWTWLVDQINLHEMAHTWFGDHIVCRDYAHAWLKESWAVYVETLWLEDSKGEDEKLYDIYRNAKAYFGEADGSYSRPLVTREFLSSWEMYDRHLYPGGACRLHTLRCELGDEVFLRGTRDYLKRFAGKVVETEDFRRVMEEHSGRSLVQFFDQWIHTAGYPDIKVSFNYDSDKKVGTFEVEQKQVKKDDKGNTPRPFVLNTDIGWVIDGELHTRPVSITKAKHSFEVEIASEPQQVRFDPLCKILHKLEFNPGDDKLKAQLTGASDVIGRILAAYALAKTGKDKNIKAIAEAYKSEKFWGVRQQWAEAIATANSEAAVSALADIVAEESDPMVMEHAFRQAGKFRDSRIAEAFQKRIEGGLPYRAHQAALEGLGAQRSAAPFELLTETASQPDLRGVVAAGAYRGIAATGRSEALPVLRNATQYGNAPIRARGHAAHALGMLASKLEKPERVQAREALEDLLRDPNHTMRRMVMNGLGASADPAAASALRSFRSRLPLQSQVDLDKIVKKLAQAEKPEVKALRGELETLQSDYRKLSARLDKLEDKGKS